MKYILLVCITFFLVFATQTSAKELPTILGQSVKGSFTQSRQLTGIPFPLISQGDYFYSKQVGLSWVTNHPLESVMLVNTDGVVVDGKKAQGSQPVIADILLAFFAGDTSQLVAFFEVDIQQQKQDWRMTLTPKSESVSQFIFRLEIEGDKFIRNFKKNLFKMSRFSKGCHIIL